MIFWFYNIGTELKLYLEDNSINPGMDILLSILCFPYFYYVVYNYSKRIYDAQIKGNVIGASDNSLAYVIISLFIPVVSSMLMQSELNRVWQNN